MLPLLGYIFLFAYALALILYRLPNLDIVYFRQFTFEYSSIWQFMIVTSFLAFLLLAIWAWNFIKVREFLRTYVVFLVLTIGVSCLGALMFTVLVFDIVKGNNLDLMNQGAKTQQLILTERSNAALFVARTVANDENIKASITQNTAQELSKQASWYFEEAGLDLLYIYNKYGEVIASPGELRDLGRVMNEDSLVAYTITERQQIKSFDTKAGVLSPVLVTRALTPIMQGSQVIGAVETRHVFDNAFVDFSKARTGLDTTIFSGDKRSATTIRTSDGISRWIGSLLNNEEIEETVLIGGKAYRDIVDRLGIPYYSAFEPVRNINGEIIGMVAVGVPTNILLEDTRQQLLTTFLTLTIVSSLVALLGYYTVHIFYLKKS